MSRNKQDPTGQGRRRKRGSRVLTIRLRNARNKVLTAFREIPRSQRRETKIQNASTVVYDYMLNPTEQQIFNDMVEQVFNDELLGSQGPMPFDWYWADHIEPPYRQGTLEETNRTNQLITASILAGSITDPFIQPVTPEQVLTSREYRQALQNKVNINFQSIKTLSSKTAAQVNRQINAGVASGKTPSEIAKGIAERVGVSESDAKRIAETEINWAYNDGKINAVDIMARRTGLRAGVLHISALLATTRSSHAARHGNAYTTADQQQWWDTGSNRINCKCSITSVLIDKKGDIVQSETQEEIQAEKKFFTKA